MSRPAYLETRGRRRFWRWNAVSHRCATDEEHQQWRREQDEELARTAAYRRRVGESAQNGRVLGMDGMVISASAPPRAEAPLTEPASPTAPMAWHLLLYFGEELPDIAGPPIETALKRSCPARNGR